MTEIAIRDFGRLAFDEIGLALDQVEEAAVAAVVQDIAKARRIVLHGVGREGLMMKALAMRLFHLGLNAHVMGDMTTPPVGEGDLFIVSAGPGWFETIQALVNLAQDAGARTICITAEPRGNVPRAADRVLVLPAQTMASDQGETGSILPMGSLFEFMQFLVFEFLVLSIRDKIGETAETMRARHTNLE